MIKIEKGKVFVTADAVRFWAYRQAAVSDQSLVIDYEAGGDAIADAVWKTVDEFLKAGPWSFRDNHTVVGLHNLVVDEWIYLFFHDSRIYFGTKVISMDGGKLPEPIEATRFSRSDYVDFLEGGM